MKTISVTELRNKLEEESDVLVLDVRNAAEVHSERADIPNLINHPLSQIELFKVPEGKTVYVICQTGMRSNKAYQCLLDKGCTNVVSVEGGLNAWKQNQYPVVKTANTFPIMRQVQIAAGSLVLLGTLGSLLIHPNFIWLAIFVGAGLTFAGLSGFCGMATMLGKMPWNKAMKQSI
jgi:rhodanese-related sulfurtransferase